MFQEATNNIKQKAAEDQLTAELYSAESQKIFYDFYALLSGIYLENAESDMNISLRLTSDKIVEILTEAKIIQEPPEEDEEEPVEGEGEERPKLIKFYEEHVREILKQIELLETGEEDTDCFTYVDFLEALIRVADAFPDPDGGDMMSMEAKLSGIVDKLHMSF